MTGRRGEREDECGAHGRRCDVQNMLLEGAIAGQALNALSTGLRLQPKVREWDDAMAAVRPSPENSAHILPIFLLSIRTFTLTACAQFICHSTPSPPHNVRINS